MGFRTATVEVDVSLEEFSSQDLIDELDARGYDVEYLNDDLDDIPDDIKIYNLYRDYLTLTSEQFEKELKIFFRNNLNVNFI